MFVIMPVCHHSFKDTMQDKAAWLGNWKLCAASGSENVKAW